MSDRIDFNEEDSNTSHNPTFDSVLQARLSRRGVLRGGVGTVGATLLGGLGLTACMGDDELLFKAVDKSLADAVVVPEGYEASVIYALGDPLAVGILAYANDGSDTHWEHRAGDHHDGMEWFGLDPAGHPSSQSVKRGLLAVNHEATTDENRSSFFIHSTGGTSTLPRPAFEVDKEIPLHGISVVEVRKTASTWGYVQNSSFNFRLTPLSEMEISGPARGNALMATQYSPGGTHCRGTLNNCGTGKTPWGTFLTGEENWAGYFTRSATDNSARGNDKSVVALNRYGRSQGAASRHGWESAGVADTYVRWNNSKLGTSADGSDDYRNEMNTFGYIVEIDPYDKTRRAKKRTGLGRLAHESAAFSNPEVGQPLAVYMGDDSRGEYIYKFVSNATWQVQDAQARHRLQVGDKYLDDGKLYVAKFNSDGSGLWVELSISNPAIAGYATYTFANQADVCINARLAADAVGATKMDRPEWCGVHPVNGEIYFTLTNNSNRRVEPTSSQQLVDSANPRAYTDMKGATAQSGNVNGHVLRMKEGDAGCSALTFSWDIYVFGAQSDADPGLVNLSSLTGDQDMSSPDGLVFSPSTGIMWIQTDDGAYTDVSNCMMLAAVPGRVGDGSTRKLTYTKADGSTLTVSTPVGKQPAATRLKRFLVGPKGCEITGLCETPDGKAIFVNIQHPGEATPMAQVNNPASYQSQWPANVGYGQGQRPRSATIVITKKNGGRIGT